MADMGHVTPAVCCGANSEQEAGGHVQHLTKQEAERGASEIHCKTNQAMLTLTV